MVTLTSISQLVLLVIIIIIYYISTILSTSGKLSLKIRRLPAIDAMEEAVGRCAETGKPLVYTIGQGSISDTNAPMMLAGLTALGFVGEKAAKVGVKIKSVFGYAEEVLIAEGLLRDAYRLHGQDLEEGMVQYQSPQGYAWTAYVIGLIQREKPGANIMIGNTTGETMGVIESASMVGAIQIGGSTNPVMLPYMVVGCDYCLLMEEIFAIGAYISKDPYSLGAMAAQDYSRLLAIILLILGSVLSFFGINIIKTLLTIK